VGKKSSSSSSSSNVTSTTVNTFDQRTAGGAGITLGAGVSGNSIYVEDIAPEVIEDILKFGGDYYAGLLGLGADLIDGIETNSKSTFELADRVIDRSRNDAEKIANNALIMAGVVMVAFVIFAGKGVKFV
jgi:hypothetical protein